MTSGAPTGAQPSAPIPSGPPLPTWQPPQSPGSSRRGWLIALVVGVIVLPVALCAVLGLAIGGFAAYWTTHQVTATSSSTQTFAVTGTGIPTITIHDPSGEVTIVAGDMAQVVVRATKRASDVSQELAQHALTTISVTSTQDGNAVTIQGATDSAHPLTQQHIDLLVTVPPHSTLDATLAAGTLRVTGVTGVIHATVSAGNAVLQGVTASGASTVSVSAGNLRYDGALDKGATLRATISTGNADVSLPQDSATTVEASTGVGTISVRGWPATVNRSGVGATTSIYLTLNPSNTLTIHVGTGNVALGPR